MEKPEKKQKTEKKTSAKHIRIRLIGGCVNKSSDINLSFYSKFSQFILLV